MQEFVVDIPRDEWWTQNRRGHWRVKFAHTSAVKQRAMAFARFWLQNGHHRPQHFPVHVTAVIHPLTHGRFDPRSREPISKKLRKAVYERDHYRCVECGATDHLSLDHIIPWSLGGEDTMENLQTM